MIVKMGLIVYEGDSEYMIRNVLLVVALIVLSVSLLGCNTVQGIGEDITWIGRKGSQVVGP
jgi:predicted small secreted protein